MIQEWKREGNLIWPLLIDNVTTDMRIAWEEPFGPVIPVLRIKSPQEGIDHCNASKLALQVIRYLPFVCSGQSQDISTSDTSLC